MIDRFLDVLNLIYPQVFGLFLIFFMLSFFWEKIFVQFSLKAYQSKQRLHNDEISRVSGFFIFLFLIIVAMFSLKSNFLNIILISAIPIIIIGTKEDLFHNTSPKLRLIMMVLSAGLFIYLTPVQLPSIDFQLANTILSIGYMREIFFIFAILVIINGNNLIDGVNGNLAFSNMIQLLSILFLASIVSDEKIIELVYVLLIPLMIFTLFNFPFGRIFCGDAGAYFYGFSISASVIYLFGSYDNLLSWNAILILIYPSIELLFSFIRKKLVENNSPLIADTKHLHSLIYRFINRQNPEFNNNNSLVTICLLPFIVAPLSTLFVEDIFGIFFIILLSIILYVMMYLFFLNKLSK